jgi:hypothetical protein
LVNLAKSIPVSQWVKLKQAVDKDISIERNTSDLEFFLLSAPTFSKKQINDIDKTRKAINEWRTSLAS